MCLVPSCCSLVPISVVFPIPIVCLYIPYMIKLLRWNCFIPSDELKVIEIANTILISVKEKSKSRLIMLQLSQ
ncbi:hypothetical protein V8C26DRAFT_407885 [Trichoderma gracile]